MSSIVQSSAIAHQPPGCSVAVPFLPSPLQLMENGFPSVHFSLWCTEKSYRVLNLQMWRMFKYSNAFIGKKLLEQKGVVSWGTVLMQHPDIVFPDIRPLLPQNLSHSLFVNTHNVCNHSHTQTSDLCEQFHWFSDCFGRFSKSKGDLDVNHLPLPPYRHWIFCITQTHVNVTLNYPHMHPLIPYIREYSAPSNNQHTLILGQEIF